MHSQTRLKLHHGFTLIELMIVVAIIGILSAIAVPKFGNLVRKAKEAAVKGGLGALRSAISIYYADTEGTFPQDTTAQNLSSLTIATKYIRTIPSVNLIGIGHPAGSSTHKKNNLAYREPNLSETTNEVWWYVENGITGLPMGEVYVNCSHTDSQGTPWSQW